jgi:TorA maturation chaperone TorD
MEVHAAIALRRSRLYRLLSRCFHDVVDTDLLRELGAELQSLRDEKPHALETLELESAMSGALHSHAAVQECERAFECLLRATTSDPLAPEHLGAELQVMAVLCLSEAQAWRSFCEREARRAIRREVDFLESHVVAWLSDLVERVSSVTAHPVCAALARFIGALCRHDRRVAAEFLDGTSFSLFAETRARWFERTVPSCASNGTSRMPRSHSAQVGAGRPGAPA